MFHPSKSEVTSGSDSDCDLHSCNDFSPINIPDGKSVTFSNPLFDSNDDFTSSDDESLSDEDVTEDNVKIYLNLLFEFDDEYISSDINHLFDEVLENIENKESYASNFGEPTLLVTPLFDANEDACFNPGGEIDKIDAFLGMDISTDIEDGYHDSEGDMICLKSLLIKDTIPNLPPEVFLNHDPRSLMDEPDNDELKNMVKVFDPGIHEEIISLTYVSLDPFVEIPSGESKVKGLNTEKKQAFSSSFRSRVLNTQSQDEFVKSPRAYHWKEREITSSTVLSLLIGPARFPFKWVSIMRMLRLKEVARNTVGMHLEFAPEVCSCFYAFSDSLLLTPLCCDDIHDVTPRVSALAGCDKLVSEPLVIENILVMFSLTRKKSRWGTIFPTGLERSLISLNRGSFDVIVGIDWLSKRKFVIVCHEKVVEIPLEGSRKLRVQGERTLGAAKALMNAKVEFRIDLVHGATSVAKSLYRLAPLEMQELSEPLQELQDKVLELLRKEKLYAKVTYLCFIADFSKIVKTLTSLTERNQKYEWGTEQEEAF
ncbi:hypothetical protein Tco_0798603 [Tanacetum coccineum]